MGVRLFSRRRTTFHQRVHEREPAQVALSAAKSGAARRATPIRPSVHGLGLGLGLGERGSCIHRQATNAARSANEQRGSAAPNCYTQEKDWRLWRSLAPWRFDFGRSQWLARLRAEDAIAQSPHRRTAAPRGHFAAPPSGVCGSARQRGYTGVRMFLGHFGVALAAKRIAPKASLGALVLGAELVDLVWPVMLLIGAEHVQVLPGATKATPLVFVDYPITHSLLGAIAWALLAALLFLRVTWYRRGALVMGGLVLSHWCLDVVSHTKDVPVLAGGPYLGLGLWQSLPATIAVEYGLLMVGAILYVRKTSPLDGVGTYGLAALLVFLGVVQLLGYWGPPPSNAQFVAYTMMANWLFVPWAVWVDRHRELAYGYEDMVPGRGRSPSMHS